MSVRIGELFAGYGGLGFGVQAAMGGEIAWVSEIDPGANKILEHRFPGVPNIGDITTVDWSTVEPVDILTGGSPCQDLSHAGRRKGMTAGTRSNLWVAMREAIAQLRPSLVVWENVRGAYSAAADSDLEFCPGCMGSPEQSGLALRALGRVLGDLSDLGYNCGWHGLRAAYVGAPHGRFRVFVVAHAADAAGRVSVQPGTPRGASAGGEGEARAHLREDARGGDRPPADAADLRHQRPRPPRGGRPGPENGGLLPTPTTEPDTGNGHARNLGKEVTLLPTPVTSYSQRDPEQWRDVRPAGNGGRREIIGDLEIVAKMPEQWGVYADAIARWEHLTRPAPPPTMLSKKGTPQLSPAFSEWMMGLPAGWVTDVPGTTRNEQLRALGNGVVPAQCAAAVSYLLGVMGTQLEDAS